jgi:hypothetical protein
MKNKNNEITDVSLRGPREESLPGSARVGNDKRGTHLAITGRLLRPTELLDQLFAPECRPSLAWLRAQIKAKSIPHVRIGHLLFFDLEMVRETLAAGCEAVRKRNEKPT